MNAQIEIKKSGPVERKKARHRVGLALSSGGAKGLSHIGVIQVLEENVLRSPANDAHWHEFNHPGKYTALGRQTGEAQLDEIKALIAENKPRHEPELAQNEMVTVA